MGRSGNRVSVLIPGLLLFAAAGILAEDDPRTGLVERVERAIVSGALDKLRVLRAEIGPGGDGSADDRYTAAYVDWRISQALSGKRSKKEKKRLLKQAQKQVESLLKDEPQHAEAHALRGTVIGERITGMIGGMMLGPKASASLKRAHELAPENPRVALQRGIGFFFTPGAFGGGLDKALPELKRSRELFEQERNDRPWPNWGRVDALAWHGQALMKSGDIDGARAAYHAALALEPEHAWIREELLPALEKKSGR